MPADVTSRTRIKGMAYAKQVFRALPEDMRKVLNLAVEESATHVLSGARRRVAPHRRYGFLERYLGLHMNEKTGVAKVGLPARIALVIPGGLAPSSRLRISQRIRRSDLRGRRKATFLVLGKGGAKGAQVVRPSKYAHLVEFGHRRGAGTSAAPPYPFMIPAAEVEKGQFAARCADQIRQLERTLSQQAPSMATVGSRLL